MKKSTKIISAGLTVLALGGLAVGGYFTYKHFNPTEQQKPVDPGVTPPDDGGEEQPLVHVMTFKVGDELLPAVNVATGGLITPPADPVKEGYIFAGWALEGTETPVDFSTLTATENMTFVALWIDEPVILEFTINNGRIDSYKGSAEEVVVPATYSLDAEGNAIRGTDFNVTEIGTAFRGKSTIKKIEIPEGVTTIRDSAFSYCSSLTSITIPNSITKIGTRAFDGCTALVYAEDNNGLYLGNDNNSFLVFAKVIDSAVASFQIVDNCKIVLDQVFANNTSVQDISIPNGVTYIGDRAFFGCTALNQIYINNTDAVGGKAVLPIELKEAGSRLFGNCTLLTSVEIPSKLTTITSQMFAGFTGLTSITIPDTVTTIKSHAFNNCTSLVSINLPNGLQSITQDMLSGCTSLASITIGNSVTSIESSAFSGCTGLASITIPESVTSIGTLAFKNCTALEFVSIPDKAISIDDSAFNGCTVLQYNTFDNGLYLGNDDNPYVVLMKATSTDITSCEINENSKVIGDSAFYDCASLASVSISSKVERISLFAFYGCTSLTSITLPESVTYITFRAFELVENLTVIIEGSTPASLSSTPVFESTAIIYVPDEAVDAYKTAWTDYTDQIKPRSEYVEA